MKSFGNEREAVPRRAATPAVPGSSCEDLSLVHVFLENNPKRFTSQSSLLCL